MKNPGVSNHLNVQSIDEQTQIIQINQINSNVL